MLFIDIFCTVITFITLLFFFYLKIVAVIITLFAKIIVAQISVRLKKKKTNLKVTFDVFFVSVNGKFNFVS